jgi:hypothetical protein
MNGSAHLSTWVNHDTKQQFAAIARHQGLSESALLKRLIDPMFRTAGYGGATIPTEASRVGRDKEAGSSNLSGRTIAFPPENPSRASTISAPNFELPADKQAEFDNLAASQVDLATHKRFPG